MHQTGPRFTVRRMMLDLGIIGLILCLVTQCPRSTVNRLAVENRSGQPISQLRIAVTGPSSVIIFEDVPDRGKVSSTFNIGHDSHFNVSGRLADGTKLNGDFGYVTNGMYGEHVDFIVKQGGEVGFSEGN
jgi:hypothetical protein